MSTHPNRDNERVYRRLKSLIDSTHPPGEFVALVDGRIVAHASDIPALLGTLDPIEPNPQKRLVVQAGVNYPEEAVIRIPRRLTG
jgi:hypothetical protein